MEHQNKQNKDNWVLNTMDILDICNHTIKLKQDVFTLFILL